MSCNSYTDKVLRRKLKYFRFKGPNQNGMNPRRWFSGFIIWLGFKSCYQVCVCIYHREIIKYLPKEDHSDRVFIQISYQRCCGGGDCFPIYMYILSLRTSLILSLLIIPLLSVTYTLLPWLSKWCFIPLFTMTTDYRYIELNSVFLVSKLKKIWEASIFRFSFPFFLFTKFKRLHISLICEAII